MSKKKMPRSHRGARKEQSHPFKAQATSPGKAPIHIWDFLTGALPTGAQFKRETAGWYFNASLVLTRAETNCPRFTYDPGGNGLQGLLVEPAATNRIRNAAASGAAAGSPGTPPTNWQPSTNANGLRRDIVGTGTEDGIPYVDIRYSGVPSGQSWLSIFADASFEVGAAIDQTWTGTWYLRLMGGSPTNTAVTLFMTERDGSGAPLISSSSSAISLESTASRMQRVDLTRTFTHASTLHATTSLAIRYASDQAIDFTLRIGLPQLVQAERPTSPIVTATDAAMRAADVLSLALPNGTYSIDIVRASGTTSLIDQAVTTGSFVVPTDLSPLQRVVATRTI